MQTIPSCRLYANNNHSHWLVGWQPGSRAADRSLQSALALLPHCHASFICCWPGAYWSYCHLEIIGNIVIWKSLAILSFDFKCWNYAKGKKPETKRLVILAILP
jgi:hypothetical protein